MRQALSSKRICNKSRTHSKSCKNYSAIQGWPQIGADHNLKIGLIASFLSSFKFRLIEASDRGC